MTATRYGRKRSSIIIFLLLSSTNIIRGVNSLTTTPTATATSFPRGISYDKIVELAQKRYCTNSPKINDNEPMKGRVAVITGAAGGIGGEISTLIYRLGGTVIALDRNTNGLEQLRNKLLLQVMQPVQQQQQQQVVVHIVDSDSDFDSDSSNTDADYNNINRNNTSNSDDDDESRIWTIQTNHEDLSSVASTAELIKSRYNHIDLLINNAGMTFPTDIHQQLTMEEEGNNNRKNVISAHGKDLVFTVNYLSHFLLTEKLLPNLCSSHNNDNNNNNKEDGRIVHITSTYHWKVDGSELMIPDVSLDNNDGPIAYQSDPKKQSLKHFERSYANTKLAQLWHSRAIGSRLKRQQQISSSTNTICSVCACPTWASTFIAGDDGSEGKEFLDKYAYSISNCGPGITSSINAIFRQDDELDDAINDGSSFVANSRLVEYLYPANILSSNFITNKLKWRDALTDFVAVLLLLLQKFTHEELIIQQTSPESYQDKQKIDQFYEWSLKEVQQWL
jgi:NAD(P)-dependent dehydrogenase (short-subunit alcohol dehydrogenase family)